MWSVEDFVEYCHEDEAKWRIMYLKAWKHNTIQYYTKWYDKDDLWFLWDIFVGKAEAFVNYLFSQVFFIDPSSSGFFIFMISIISLKMCRYYRLGNVFLKYVYFFKPIIILFFLGSSCRTRRPLAWKSRSSWCCRHWYSSRTFWRGSKGLHSKETGL